jgi:PKD repeat protein
LTFSWDFGDGNTSDHENPDHAYSATGTYIAVLRVMDSRGFVDADTVVVRVVEPLTVEASITSDPCVGPCTVSFQASATGGVPPYTFLWNFGNMMGGTSTSQSPSYLYHPPPIPGDTYTATVFVTDELGDTASDSLEVDVGGGGPIPPMP